MKSPANEVGPLHISHDAMLGKSDVYYDEKSVDPLEYLRLHATGIDAAQLAKAMFGTEEPDRAQVMKALRRLQGFERAGLATSMTIAGPRGGRPQHHFWPAITAGITTAREGA